MGQVTLRFEHNDGVPATQMFFQVIRHRCGDRMVFSGLDYATGYPDEAQKLPQVAVEHHLRSEERNIGAHVEQGPTKLSDRRRNICSNGEWREAADPRRVIPLHCQKHFINLFLLEPSVVVLVVQEPKPQIIQQIEQSNFWV